jgi:hypothetical protein
MSVVPFKKPEKTILSPQFEASADRDTLGCIRFSYEEMEALKQIQCDAIEGETVFKDVTLNASSHETSYTFRLTAFEPPFISLRKIRSGEGYAYTLSIQQQEPEFFSDFNAMLVFAEEVRDEAIPRAKELQIKATLAAQQNDYPVASR